MSTPMMQHSRWTAQATNEWVCHRKGCRDKTLPGPPASVRLRRYLRWIHATVTAPPVT